MRRHRFRAGLVLSLVLLSTAVPAHGGNALPPLVVNPTSGPPGSNIAVSGSGCGLLPGDTTILLNLLSGGTTVAFAEIPTGLLGAWNGVLTVPANATAGQVFQVTAFCGPEGSQYPPVSFTVTGTAPPPPTPVPTPIPTPPRFTG